MSRLQSWIIVVAVVVIALVQVIELSMAMQARAEQNSILKMQSEM